MHEKRTSRHRRVMLGACVVSALLATAAAQAVAARTDFVTTAVDETFRLETTSAACGFPVFERDTGTLTTALTATPNGSTKAHDIAVHITITFFSTDPAHTGIVTTSGPGGLVEIDHPDGSVTALYHGQNGHATAPGEGLVYASSGVTRVEIDASGNVTEVAHGNFSPDHSGICPLL